MFKLGKFSIIITTRCNLRCKLCCEYIPQNKPFPDITAEQMRRILASFFEVVGSVDTLHLTGGGEPFLHPELPNLVEVCMDYDASFGRLMLFTNCTIMPSQRLLKMLNRYRDKIVIQVSRYGINPEREQDILSVLRESGTTLKIETYYGGQQSFNGWVDFGEWKYQNRTESELERIYKNCATTRDMHGNWRTRDGKVHWCSRSQRGTELGLIPDDPNDYVDLLAAQTVEEKRAKFRAIEHRRYLAACDYCSGDQGTSDLSKRFPAAQQLTW